jgi:protein SCO1/2
MAGVSRGGLIATGAAVVTAFGLGVWLSARFASDRDDALPTLPALDIGGFVLPEPRPLGGFELVDHEGKPFRASDFEGAWSFLYFGYTYCPDVCPLTLLELAGLKERLAESCENLTDRYYLVSVDPKRDTPARLRDYVTYFDPEFRGLTGALEEIDKLTTQVGAIYSYPEGQEAENYLVGHSSTVTLIDPNGRYHGVFTTPHTAASMAADFPKILERYRGMEPRSQNAVCTPR